MNVPDYDSPWKELLDNFFEEFMSFFFPEAYARIDWTRGYELLYQVLQAITADAAIGRRTVDKLVKVWLLDGREAWAMIHCEVQGEREDVFEERIYIYRNRIRERYHAPVASFVVLTDDSPNWRPNEFREEILGTVATLKFTSIKILDYRDRWEELEQHPSIFAIVVMATLKLIETKGNPIERSVWKLRLTRMLIARGYERLTVVNLFRFLDWMVWLPPDLQQDFKDEAHKIVEEPKMPYVTPTERLAMVEMATRQINRLIGPIDKALETKILWSAAEEIKQLAVDLLGFKTQADLETWLQAHPKQDAPPYSWMQ